MNSRSRDHDNNMVSWSLWTWVTVNKFETWFSKFTSRVGFCIHDLRTITECYPLAWSPVWARMESLSKNENAFCVSERKTEKGEKREWENSDMPWQRRVTTVAGWSPMTCESIRWWWPWMTVSQTARTTWTSLETLTAYTGPSLYDVIFENGILNGQKSILARGTNRLAFNKILDKTYEVLLKQY